MYDKFYQYLVDLEETFHNLSALLKKKMVALEKLDVETIDSVINEEQAFALITRGFDKNIKVHREALGLQGDRLSEIIEELPDNEQNRFREVFRTLKAALDEVQALQDKCRGLIEERLRSLDKSIREMDSAATKAYGKGGSADTKKGEQAHLLTKTI